MQNSPNLGVFSDEGVCQGRQDPSLFQKAIKLCLTFGVNTQFKVRSFLPFELRCPSCVRSFLHYDVVAQVEKNMIFLKRYAAVQPTF